jgi:hypothetical protein
MRTQPLSFGYQAGAAMTDDDAFQDRCPGCDAPLCVNCARCLCRECCTARRVIVIFQDPQPHEVLAERVPLWVCDECRPVVEAELKVIGLSRV